MIEKLTQENFEHILNVLILYNQLTPKETEVYLNEKSIKEAFAFMSNQGANLAKQLGM